MSRWLARLRVPLGFVSAVAALALAQPGWTSWTIGLPIALAGEGLRCWAAGHIDKGREITRSGPYRFVRHPLYLGSTAIALGFVVAARSWTVAGVAAVYLSLTLLAAVRLEEASLDARFQGAYTAYREGRAGDVDRRFTWTRVLANREYKAMLGFVVAFAFLAWRIGRP